MASLIASACPTFSSSFTSSSPLHAKPSQLLANAKRNQRFKVKATGIDGTSKTNSQSAETSVGKLDRRNMLLGMGGLYGAADTMGQRLALADSSGLPIPYPDLRSCTTAYYDRGISEPIEDRCCPSMAEEVMPYTIPENQPKRVRSAAHLVDDEYIQKYMKALKEMRALPDDDPWSFKQQADIHCAYCNYGHRLHNDEDEKGIMFQVHNNWFFAAFHRWYIYFFEKIAGKLIGDETFALPYWNWDTPCGMTIPYMYCTEKSIFDPSEDNPLYDAKRKQTSLPPSVYTLSTTPADTPDIQKVCNNLAYMYRIMVTNGQDPESFHGKPYFYGDDPKFNQPGSLEILHNPAHGWVGGVRGSEETPYGEDMGNFYSSGRDPIFYAHHANIDRLWSIWQKTKGKDFNNQAWLDSQFFFWDENRKPVYVTVRDCLDHERLGYTYQPMELPWLKAKPMPRATKKHFPKASVAPSVPNVFPTKLEKVVKVSVQRPKKSRSKEQKEKKKEILVIEGIDHPMDVPVEFQVFINDNDDKNFVLSKAEYVGSFGTVPIGGPSHEHSASNTTSTNVTFELDEILEDLQAEDDEFIEVKLVPNSEGDKITMDNIKIDFK